VVLDWPAMCALWAWRTSLRRSSVAKLNFGVALRLDDGAQAVAGNTEIGGFAPLQSDTLAEAVEKLNAIGGNVGR
jgi:hypothetical protein